MVKFAQGQEPARWRGPRRSKSDPQDLEQIHRLSEKIDLSPKRWTLAVFALICLPLGKFLMVRKRVTEEWTLPGGRVKRGESVSAALLRETEEETGLELLQGPVIGILERADQRQLCLYFRCHPRSWPTRLRKGGSTEIMEFRAAKLKELPAPMAPQAAKILKHLHSAGAAAVWVPNFQTMEPFVASSALSTRSQTRQPKASSIQKK
jgi:8-oxo-dGTP pyrophosphatase MutT (NUDIX family)